MAAFDFAQWKWDLAGLAGAFAIAVLQKFWRDYQQRRSESWPISYGRIDSVSVDTQEKTTKIKCYYRYSVSAESFTGSFQKSFEDPDEANTWADALDKKQVAVRYEPGNPSRSQLREVDLEPMVRAAAPFRPTSAADHVPAWERELATVGIVAAIIGLAVTVTMLAGEIVGKTLVPARLASIVGMGGYVVFGVALVARQRGKQRARALPGWMKYMGYALLYYAVFSATLNPSRVRSEHATDTRRQHETFMDARYQLFLYFSALEWCYARLHTREDGMHSGDQAGLFQR